MSTPNPPTFEDVAKELGSKAANYNNPFLPCTSAAKAYFDGFLLTHRVEYSFIPMDDVSIYLLWWNIDHE